MMCCSRLSPVLGHALVSTGVAICVSFGSLHCKISPRCSRTNPRCRTSLSANEARAARQTSLRRTTRHKQARRRSTQHQSLAASSLHGTQSDAVKQARAARQARAVRQATSPPRRNTKLAIWRHAPVTTQVRFWGGRPGAPKRVHEPSYALCACSGPCSIAWEARTSIDEKYEHPPLPARMFRFGPPPH